MAPPPCARSSAAAPRRAAGDSGRNLTARERQVLALLADGLSNTEIAARLVVSRSAVKSHVSSSITKLGASSRTEAATIPVRQGLI